MNAIVKAVEAELKHYPGVEMKLDDRRAGHPRLVFSKDEASRFLVIPKTPSDHRADQNVVKVFRKTMAELGASRLAPPKTRKSSRAAAYFTLNERSVAVAISGRSPLVERFKTKDNQATGVWSYELRSSPDLSSPPMLAMKRHELPEGKHVQPGQVRGFYQSNTGGWRVTMARNQVPALKRMAPTLKSTPLELYQDNGDELVFKLPPGVLPTSFRKREEPVEEPVEETPEREEAPETATKPEPLAGLADKPIVLQFPKQPVSVEAAIAILNRAKVRLGSNLRFTIEEGGFLSAVHRIGK